MPLALPGDEKRRDVVAVDNFSDDDYMVQTNLDFQSKEGALIWVWFTDMDNGYRVFLGGTSSTIELVEFHKGRVTTLASGTHFAMTSAAVKIKVNGTSIKVWVDGNLDTNAADGDIAYGGVAFDGDNPAFDNLKIGYDNNADDAGDDLVTYEDFGGSSASPAHDHAGILVEDAAFR